MSQKTEQLDHAKSALQSFKRGDYDKTIEDCRCLIESAMIKDSDIVVEAYYLWCLACLKKDDFEQAKQVLNEAQKRLGEYLDLVYFELITAAAEERIDKVVDSAFRYMELWQKIDNNISLVRHKTASRAGEVLLIWGQALEQMKDAQKAKNVYEKYLKLYPEDKAIEARLVELAKRI